MSHELDQHQSDPWSIFISWYENASGTKPTSQVDKLLFPMRQIVRKIYPPFSLHGGDAMVLSTATREGSPSGRVVLYKGLWDGGVVFYTNYNSQKGAELLANPKASLTFHWSLPERQVRVKGLVAKVSDEKSDHYWASRPRGSQIGAWASQQSETIATREELLSKTQEFEQKFASGAVPRPPHWGGFVVRPQTIEFWEACVARLHRRRRYQVSSSGTWESELLCP